MLIGGIGTTVTIGGRIRHYLRGPAALFATDHPSKTQGAKGAQSSLFEVDGGVGRKLLRCWTARRRGMQDFRDDDGNLLTVAPDTIIIPNSGALKRKIFEAVGSDTDPNTSNNAFNFQWGCGTCSFGTICPRR